MVPHIPGAPNAAIKNSFAPIRKTYRKLRATDGVESTAVKGELMDLNPMVDKGCVIEAAEASVARDPENFLCTADFVTGQFHPTHKRMAEDLICRHFDHMPAEIEALRGPGFNLAERIREYHGPGIRLYSMKMSLPRVRDIRILSDFITVKYQFDTDFDGALIALERYQASYVDMVVGDTLAAGRNHPNYTRFASFFRCLNPEWESAFLVSTAEFAYTQGIKGPLLRVEGAYALMEGNVNTHSCKVQTKQADEYKENWLISFKVGQPVQVGSAAHLHLRAPAVRLLRKLTDDMLVDAKFGGPNCTMEDMQVHLADSLGAKTYGFDVAQCDSSHHADFLIVITHLLEDKIGFIPPFLRDTLEYMRLSMLRWRCRSRTGAVKANVSHQLASGSPWTFLLNCLWALWNLCLVSEKRPELVAIAGDDGVSCGVTLPTGEIRSSAGVILKISHEPNGVLFCHHLFTKQGVFPHAIRSLSKFLCRNTPGEKELEETREALHTLYKRYRDTQWAAALCQAYEERLGIPREHSFLALELIFRITNTPAVKLLAMTHSVRLRPLTLF